MKNKIKKLIKEKNLDKILKYVKKQNKLNKINKINKIKKKKYKYIYIQKCKLKNIKKKIKKILIKKKKIINIKIKKKILNEYYETYSYMNYNKYIKKTNILNKLSRYTYFNKNYESSKREYVFFYKTFAPDFSQYICNLHYYISDNFFINKYYMKKKYKKINVINYDFLNKNYVIKKIFHKTNSNKKLYLYFYLIYEKNHINNGYLILSCNKKTNISYIFDGRYIKKFFRYKIKSQKYYDKLKKNKKRCYKNKALHYKSRALYYKNKEIKLFNYVFQLAKNNNMKEMYINDYCNYYIKNKYDNYVNFQKIYSKKNNKSWYQKIGFFESKNNNYLLKKL